MPTDEEMSDSAKKLARRKIKPIVEFFPVDWDETGVSRSFIDTKKPDRKLLRDILQSKKGIYSFYNSEFEIIYLGKTKNNLFNEMKVAYTRQMTHYKRFHVRHPRSRFEETSAGQVRKIMNMNTHLYDNAIYFSAYDIEDDDLIDMFEMLMLRMIPNDVLNMRIEGNNTLKMTDK